jgi:hypothetical protein
MKKIKSITHEGLALALEKAERYRLLNEPSEAESICRDILELEPDNQKAIVLQILTLSDQFENGTSDTEAKNLLKKIEDNYQRIYYRGIILERLAKATLNRGALGASFDAYEWLTDAMKAFEDAERIRPAGNDDAILRFNTCLRIIQKHNLHERQREAEHSLE